MTALRLVAVRHAPVASTWRGRCYGAIDVDVEMPHAEAAETVAARLEVRPDRIWSSDLERCRGLASTLSERVGAPHRVDDALRELNHGVFEGRAWDEIHRDDPGALARWGEHWLHEGPPDGESALDVERRVRGWLEGLRREEAHLVVTHAGVIRALRVLRGECGWSDALSVAVPHLEPIAFGDA